MSIVHTDPVRERGRRLLLGALALILALTAAVLFFVAHRLIFGLWADLSAMLNGLLR